MLDALPLNWAILKNPTNWAIVVLMVTFGSLALFRFRDEITK